MPHGQALRRRPQSLRPDVLGSTCCCCCYWERQPKVCACWAPLRQRSAHCCWQPHTAWHQWWPFLLPPTVCTCTQGAQHASGLVQPQLHTQARCRSRAARFPSHLACLAAPTSSTTAPATHPAEPPTHLVVDHIQHKGRSANPQPRHRVPHVVREERVLPPRLRLPPVVRHTAAGRSRAGGRTHARVQLVLATECATAAGLPSLLGAWDKLASLQQLWWATGNQQGHGGAAQRGPCPAAGLVRGVPTLQLPPPGVSAGRRSGLGIASRCSHTQRRSTGAALHWNWPIASVAGEPGGA